MSGPLGVFLNDGGELYVGDLPDPGTPPAPATPPASTTPTWTPEPVYPVGKPSPDDLFRFLGWPPPDLEQALAAQAHLDRAATLVSAYTRRRGFIGNGMLNAEIAQVIVSTAARTMNNPTSDSRVTAGQYAATPGQPDWTLTERLVLDGFRRRIA